MKSGNNFAPHAIMENPESQTEFQPLPGSDPLLEKSQTLPPPEPPAITVRDLSVAFGEHRFSKPCRSTFPPVAVTAIIGPSGCGKSTFLRALNRMHDLVPAASVEGEVRLFGENIYGRQVEAVLVRRRVGMVFQKSNPFPTMSIAENVTVGLTLNGVRSHSVLRERMTESLVMSALWDEVKDRLDAPAMSLSGGQQQRLCIARALAVNPMCCSWMNQPRRWIRSPLRRSKT